MKCPKCGKIIPEGKLYCENCGTEIKIVKEYDAGLEQRISDNMDSIREEVRRQIEEEEEAKLKAERDKARHRELCVFAGFGAAILLLVLLIVYYFVRPSQARCVGKAYEAAQNGDFTKAASYIDRAIENAAADDARELVFTKMDYLIEAAEYGPAEEAARGVIDDENASEDQISNAYKYLIDIYSLQNRYAEIAEFIDQSPEYVRSKYSDYLSTAPVFSKESGEYEDSVNLILTDEAGGSIFYTLDGSEPDINSAIYSEPIRLTNGEYVITAAAVNKYGVTSPTAKAVYKIGTDRPDAPTVETDSGEYAGATLIKVAAPENGKVYYTTDGTDPTEDSEVYSSPIEMPSGESVYRFAVIDDNGNRSDVVERTYTMIPSAEISINDGPVLITTALIGLGQVLDTNGTVTGGGNARYAYSYAGMSTVQGYGSFFIYDEILVDAAGNTASTGRRFAVNISNAIVNLYSDAGQIVPIN